MFNILKIEGLAIGDKIAEFIHYNLIFDTEINFIECVSILKLHCTSGYFVFLFFRHSIVHSSYMYSQVLGKILIQSYRLKKNKFVIVVEKFVKVFHTSVGVPN